MVLVKSEQARLSVEELVEMIVTKPLLASYWNLLDHRGKIRRNTSQLPKETSTDTEVIAKTDSGENLSASTEALSLESTGTSSPKTLILWPFSNGITPILVQLGQATLGYRWHLWASIGQRHSSLGWLLFRTHRMWSQCLFLPAPQPLRTCWKLWNSVNPANIQRNYLPSECLLTMYNKSIAGITLFFHLGSFIIIWNKW